MANIEEACVNEKTKDDAKTWNYAGLIYAKFVELSTSTDPKDQKLFKKQKVDTPIEQLADKAQDALIKSMELEKKAGTNEFATSNNGALIVVSGYQLDRAINFFNEGKYEECIPLFEKAATAAKACGQGDILNRSKLVMAMAYDALKQKDKAVEIYRELVKSGAKEKEAYINLYVANVANKEMDKAINVLKKGVKVSGATVHFVTEECDGGPIILQKAVAVEEGDTPETLQRRIMEQAEWKILPRAAALFCAGRLRVEDGIVHILEENGRDGKEKQNGTF